MKKGKEFYKNRFKQYLFLFLNIEPYFIYYIRINLKFTNNYYIEIILEKIYQL